MIKCAWENCPILEIMDEVGIDKFAEAIKMEKKRAAGLLKDGACMVLSVQEFRSLRKTAKVEK